MVNQESAFSLYVYCESANDFYADETLMCPVCVVFLQGHGKTVACLGLFKLRPQRSDFGARDALAPRLSSLLRLLLLAKAGSRSLCSTPGLPLLTWHIRRIGLHGQVSSTTAF
jgi:hypothetical protein